MENSAINMPILDPKINGKYFFQKTLSLASHVWFPQIALFAKF